MHLIVGGDLPVDGDWLDPTPPPCSGSGARRVQRTTLLWVGSPEATPSVNGGGEGSNADARRAPSLVASDSPASAVPPRKARRLMWETVGTIREW